MERLEYNKCKCLNQSQNNPKNVKVTVTNQQQCFGLSFEQFKEIQVETAAKAAQAASDISTLKQEKHDLEVKLQTFEFENQLITRDKQSF